MVKRVFHGLFWLIIFLVWQQLVYFYISNPVNRLLFTGFDVTLMALTFYLLYYWVAPSWLHGSNQLPFWSGTLLTILLGAGLSGVTMLLFLHRGIVPIHFDFYWNYRFMVNNRLLIAVVGAGTGLLAYLAMSYVKSQKRIVQKEKEAIAAELNYLKAQINPHFLFNSINSIYVQIDQNTEAAKDSLAMFSDMLRYQLYECGTEQVPLQNELDYIRNYIHLQQLRKDERYQIEFDLPQSAGGAMVAPFLLLPLVENMFKHVSNFSDKENFMKGSIRVEKNLLHFTGVNSKNGITQGDLVGSAQDYSPARARRGHPGTGPQGEGRPGTGYPGAGRPGSTQTQEGIGLVNVQRRLELLYPGKHILKIQDNGQTFTINLEVPLS
jgi:two-component system LytT family sensor kinase